MKALEQNYRTGNLRVVELPEPNAARGRITVRTAASLASVGTEKGMLELARKSLVGKARARPDLVRQVIDKFRTEGIVETWRQVMGRLDTPITLGYSSAGVVTDVGPDVTDFRIGDRVACAGSGYAGHIEVASVPVNLCTRIPASVSYENSSFVAVGAIALEAVRMARVGLGERVVVIGLGLLGQVAVQLLHAAGCHVFGVDLSPSKAELTLNHGAEQASSGDSMDSVVDAVAAWTNGEGVDAAIIFASTDSNEPLEQAAAMCRERGRVVATGLVGLDVPRRIFYDKELELVISRAWGPGLYDPEYAENGTSYPIAYARWTANRNMSEFLAQLERDSIKVNHLITHRFTIESAVEAYNMILEGAEPYIGVVLTYPFADEFDSSPNQITNGSSNGAVKPSKTVWTKEANEPGHTSAGSTSDSVGIGLIGAGLFANGTLIPAIKSLSGLRLRGVATNTGFSGHHTAEKHGFDYCTTDYKQLLDDSDVDLVLVLTRHGSHSQFAAEALAAGKHVFVEKPLAININQLRQVAESFGDAQAKASEARANPPLLAVGFNRRFSPFAVWLKERFENVNEPLTVNCVINAGSVPYESWVNDPLQGGGRIIGEVCHFVDLINFFTSSTPSRVYVEPVAANGSEDDSIVATIALENGSIANISYLARGDKRYPRERIEVFGGGAVGVIDNFKSASFYRNGRTQKRRGRLSVDRGHRGEIEALLSAIKGMNPPSVDFGEYVSTTLTTFAMIRSLQTASPEKLDYEGLAKGETD